MEWGGGVAGSILADAVAALTSWQLFLQNSPPSVPYAPLPVPLSPHIL